MSTIRIRPAQGLQLSHLKARFVPVAGVHAPALFGLSGLSFAPTVQQPRDSPVSCVVRGGLRNTAAAVVIALGYRSQGCLPALTVQEFDPSHIFLRDLGKCVCGPMLAPPERAG